MDSTTADVIELATTRDAAKFVDAVNSILSRKAVETIEGMRAQVAQSIINPTADQTSHASAEEDTDEEV
jgi:hypothetical protein